MTMLLGLFKIWKTGNSCGITIPARLSKSIGIKKGDSVKMYYHESENKLEIFLNP